MEPVSPLDQLRDIHLPEPVSMFPAAVGWYGILFVILITLSCVAYFFIQRRQKNAYRRTGVTKLKELKKARAGLGELNALLKQVAISAYGRPKVSRLTGSDWTGFLSESSGLSLSVEDETKLTTGVYRSTGETPESLWKFAQEWIQSHKTDLESISKNSGVIADA